MSNGNIDRDTWLTPPYVVRALGKFDLDPSCPPAMPWATARRMLTLADNGLLTPWSGRVWLNPPYSDIADWVARLAAHGNGIALVNAATGTAAFRDHVWKVASAILFLYGRLRFHLPDGASSRCSSRFSSVLVAYDPHDSHVNADALRDSGLAGFFVPLGAIRTPKSGVALAEQDGMIRSP